MVFLFLLKLLLHHSKRDFVRVFVVRLLGRGTNRTCALPGFDHHLRAVLTKLTPPTNVGTLVSFLRAGQSFGLVLLSLALLAFLNEHVGDALEFTVEEV